MPADNLYFYYRNGCHLCEEMAAKLHSGWPELFERLQWIDVDSSPVLRERFGVLVPVLAVDEDVVCHHFLDEAAVEKLSMRSL